LKEVQVDRDGKFCYGRLILTMINMMRSGIIPRQSTGVRSHIDLFTAFRR